MFHFRHVSTPAKNVAAPDVITKFPSWCIFSSDTRERVMPSPAPHSQRRLLRRRRSSVASSFLARGGLGRHVDRIQCPPPRILEGPFRNVDPHTASLAVYFRGPASELFNMLNPESPGAISVFSHVATRARARIRVCINVKRRRYMCETCARACVGVT